MVTYAPYHQFWVEVVHIYSLHNKYQIFQQYFNPLQMLLLSNMGLRILEIQTEPTKISQQTRNDQHIVPEPLETYPMVILS